MAYQAEGEKLQKEYMTNPDRFAPYADWCRKNGDLDLALEIVQTGLTKKPNYLSGHIVLGRCFIDQKKDTEAGKAFERVLELDAENIIALRFLAEITERQGDSPSALRWLKRLLEVDPSNDDAVEALKRLESAAPAAAVAPVPAAEAAASLHGAETVSGFESTSFEETPAAPAPMVAPAPAANDFMIEQASSPFETPPEEAAAEGMDQFGMEPTELSLSDAAGGRGGMLDLQTAESEMVFDESVPARSSLPDAPASTEPPMLTFDDTPHAPEPASEPQPLAAMSLEPDPPARPARKSVTAAAPAGDLPLIMPDDLEPAPPSRRSMAASAPPAAVAPVVQEPEPVITETMAEVYARQGLIAEARDVYRKLIEQRPRDAGLRQRLAELEKQRTSPPKGMPSPMAPAAASKRFAAAAPGGQSARSLFGKVLAAKPGAPPPRPEPPPMSAMDAAFADEPIQAHGAPTRPTSDELSLAAVFGEEPMPPAPAPKPSGDAPQAPAAGGGFSFDEFFGGKKGEAPASPAPEAAAGEGDGRSPDDFVSWLKGLKS